MKSLVIIITVLFFSTTKSIGQIDLAYDSIVNLNLSAYASKPVDSFLQKIPQSYTYIKILGYTKGTRAHGLTITYPSGMTIWITPKNFVFMNPIDTNLVWDLTLFKKETASYITVTHPDFNTLTGSHP